MAEFFKANERDLAEAYLKERRNRFPHSTYKIIEISGFFCTHDNGRKSKEWGGFVVAPKVAFQYENKHYVGWGKSRAAVREFENQ